MTVRISCGRTPFLSNVRAHAGLIYREGGPRFRHLSRRQMNDFEPLFAFLRVIIVHEQKWERFHITISGGFGSPHFLYDWATIVVNK